MTYYRILFLLMLQHRSCREKNVLAYLTFTDHFTGGSSGEFSAMGESLTEQCRMEVEGPRVVNFFSRRRSNDGIWGISIG
ncbi:hypothetical protein KY290_018362 [Solanum tuberosum]|uniref:Secreted protein n=1 Tax=Solanum tuberosum TaxID=4113 RepID=A0ABQ7VE26_SOLTU|nr:hypothetical protein KY285_017314 [Solanum tuberosum]KAH0762289.1 hypothetical protein KY290_018362 [Solanum tuberosum]